MIKARIYCPAKTATQSGQAKSKKWVLEYVSESKKTPNPLMGWASSTDTFAQVKLIFNSKEEAIAFAQEKGLSYTVLKNNKSKFKPKNYADNFKYDRRGVWTH